MLNKIKNTDILTVVLFVLFCAAIFGIHSFDWDHFYTAFEVDRTSYLSFELPVWSYSFCAGVPRLADPQSFALSPFFIFTLFFGPVVGLKLLVFVCMLIGYHYIKKYFLFHEVEYDHAALVSASFILSSFFVWHATVGHITFLLYLPGFGIFYYLYKAFFKKLNQKEYIALLLICTSVFYAGFYPVLLYFFMPLFLVLVASIIVNYFVNKDLLRSNGKNIASSVGIVIFSFLVSLPRILPVVFEQMELPRKLARMNESLTFGDLVSSFFSPVFKLKYLFDLGESRPWQVWEYSHFSLLTMFCFILIVFGFKKIKTFSKNDLTTLVLGVFCIVIGFGFGIGDFSHLSPFFMLKQIMGGGVRVPSRYLFLVSFGAMIILPLFLNTLSKRKIVLPCLGFILFVTFIQSLNSFQFQNSNVTKALFTMERRKNLGMLFAKKNVNVMYPYVKQGIVAANCYNPMNKVSNLKLREDEFKLLERGRLYFLDSEDENCKRDSFLTENSFSLAESCKNKKICLNLNRVRKEDIERYALKRANANSKLCGVYK